MSQLSKFSTYTKDAAAKARAEEATTGWFKFKPGTNVVRFLPPLVGMDEPWVTVAQHFLKLPGNVSINFNCPRKMANSRCPSCEKADRLKATGNPVDEKVAKDFWPNFRNIAFVLDRDNMKGGIQLCSFGNTIKKRLRHFREKLNKDYTHLETGNDIVIERVGTDVNTEYQTDLGEMCPVTNDMAQLEAWAADLPDLQDFTKVLDYETILQKCSATTVGSAGAGVAVQSRQAKAAIAGSVQDDLHEVDGTGDPY